MSDNGSKAKWTHEHSHTTIIKMWIEYIIKSI